MMRMTLITDNLTISFYGKFATILRTKVDVLNFYAKIVTICYTIQNNDTNDGPRMSIFHPL